MHCELKSISADALSYATAQNAIGHSPAEILENEFILCGASCIAYAGLMQVNKHMAQVFKEKIKASYSKNIVIDAFLSLGLSETFCINTMAMNDAAAPADRIDVLKKQLSLIDCNNMS